MMSQQRYVHYQRPNDTLSASLDCDLNVQTYSDWHAHTEISQRRKRRLDTYRLNHISHAVTYEQFANFVSQDEHMKVLVLRQRWLDSRSKRLSSSKTKNPASCSKEVGELKINGRLSQEGLCSISRESACAPSTSNAALHNLKSVQSSGRRVMSKASTSSRNHATAVVDKLPCISKVVKFSLDGSQTQRAHTANNNAIGEFSTVLNECMALDIDLGDLSDLCCFLDGASSENTDFIHILNHEFNQDLRPIHPISNVDSSTLKNAVADRSINNGIVDSARNVVWGSTAVACGAMQSEARSLGLVAIPSSSEFKSCVKPVETPATSFECSKDTIGKTVSSTHLVSYSDVLHNSSSSNPYFSVACQSNQVSHDNTHFFDNAGTIHQLRMKNYWQFKQHHMQEEQQHLKNAYQCMPQLHVEPDCVPVNQVFVSSRNNNHVPTAIQSKHIVSCNGMMASIGTQQQQESDFLPSVMLRNRNNYNTVAADVFSATNFNADHVHNAHVKKLNSLHAVSSAGATEASVRSSPSLNFGNSLAEITEHTSSRPMHYDIPLQRNWYGVHDGYLQYSDKNSSASAHLAGQVLSQDVSYGSLNMGSNPQPPNSCTTVEGIAYPWPGPRQEMIRQQAMAVSSPAVIYGSSTMDI